MDEIKHCIECWGAVVEIVRSDKTKIGRGELPKYKHLKKENCRKDVLFDKDVE